MTNRDLLNRVYSTISSLRQNLPTTVFVAQPYVDLYHKALDNSTPRAWMSATTEFPLRLVAHISRGPYLPSFGRCGAFVES